MKLTDNFVCSHRRGNICLRFLKGCGKRAECYHVCAECRTYFMPPGQEPCFSCLYLEAALRERVGFRKGGKAGG